MPFLFMFVKILNMKRFLNSFLAITLVLFTSCNQNKKEVAVRRAIDTTIDTIGSGTGFLKHLHKKRTFKFYDQTLEKYLASSPLRPDDTHKVIYLLPVGTIDSSLVDLIKNEQDYLQRFFQLDVKVLPGVGMDDLKNVNKVETRLHSSTHIYGKESNEAALEQVEAHSLIINYIVPNKPKDAVAILGITEYDIYLQDYNYIFGTSDLHAGTGLISLYRLKNLAGIRNVASKQITNLFSIPNTKDYDCLLNYHDNVEDQEAGVSFLSPLALQKLKISIGFDFKKRFEDLEEFWKQQSDIENARYYTNCLKALRDSPIYTTSANK